MSKDVYEKWKTEAPQKVYELCEYFQIGNDQHAAVSAQHVGRIQTCALEGPSNFIALIKCHTPGVSFTANEKVSDRSQQQPMFDLSLCQPSGPPLHRQSRFCCSWLSKRPAAQYKYIPRR